MAGPDQVRVLEFFLMLFIIIRHVLRIDCNRRGYGLLDIFGHRQRFLELASQARSIEPAICQSRIHFSIAAEVLGKFGKLRLNLRLARFNAAGVSLLIHQFGPDKRSERLAYQLLLVLPPEVIPLRIPDWGQFVLDALFEVPSQYGLTVNPRDDCRKESAGSGRRNLLLLGSFLDFFGGRGLWRCGSALDRRRGSFRLCVDETVSNQSQNRSPKDGHNKRQY